jgi:ubiquinone biosynthesis protein COQ9
MVNENTDENTDENAGKNMGENTDKNTGENGVDQAKDRLLDAVLPHVAFDGWSEVSFRAGIVDSGVASGLARALFPRGGVDLALAYHRRGDGLMQAGLAARDLGALRYRERVTLAVRTRLEVISDAEAVRRGSALFALPQHAADGARAIWGTADAIWIALGDASTDINWYTKRATLSAVYASTVLYWLGDELDDHAATWAFLDRRIENVMAIEKVKAKLRDNPLWKAVADGPLKAMSRIRMPKVPDDLPGRFGS